MSTQPILTPEILVPRLGEYLVEKKLISTDDLKRALDVQASYRTDEKYPPLLGQILIQLEMIDRSGLDEVITEQIIQLREALEKTNQQLEQRVKQRTIELERALTRLSELNKIKTNFVSNISHELRTPLTHIIGYLGLLIPADLGPLTKEQRESLNIIQRATARLEKLIDDLILFSTSEQSQLELRIDLFDLNMLFKNIYEKSLEKARKGNVNLRIENTPNLPYVSADEEKIAWVLLQLVDNAIKFTPPSGEVVMLNKLVEKVVQVTVSDSGIGIPDDRLDEIFEPFHQLDGTSTRKYGGTGLGLSLVKKILDAHGSVLHITSEIDKGTQFNFTLYSPH
ncbi:MAG: HAMP domain-containing histidine kinase [Anaerolineaceae bacterium]|nr:HAMP domain-containing histidine kinase [Anaerolineaceae bacterium]